MTGRIAVLAFGLAVSACTGSAGTPAPQRRAGGVVLDTARLLGDIGVLAADSLQGRQTGTQGAEKARRYLLQRFHEIGLDSLGPGYAHPFTFTGRDGVERRGANLVGVVRGTETPDRFLVVTAHYDHVGIGRAVNGDSIYNGADDNASGTAAILALARYFTANPPKNSLIFAALDAEEMGLQGAKAFVVNPPVPVSNLAANLNMDMVSRSERGELFAAGTYHYPFLRAPLDRVAAEAPVSLRFGHDSPDLPRGEDWTNQSDHGAFHAAGIPFVYFGVEDHPDYHRPSDSVDRINPDFYVRAVETVRRVISELDRHLTVIDAVRKRP